MWSEPFLLKKLSRKPQVCVSTDSTFTALPCQDLYSEDNIHFKSKSHWPLVEFQMVPVTLGQNQAIFLYNSQAPLKILLSVRNYQPNLRLLQVDILGKTNTNWRRRYEVKLSSWALVTGCGFLACHKYTVPQGSRLFIYLVYPCEWVMS